MPIKTFCLAALDWRFFSLGMKLVHGLPLSSIVGFFFVQLTAEEKGDG